ncbi:M23 family metallopeptidase [Hyphomicrobium sp.]|uniref:M23 family metallopeptidase n=1 Tax=Hyphomicrobium sp. TaxID=82 RepID=UPI002E328D83|nr:M23 family metallopeptidase [Hyphomicrobium sp.]HEX2842311.1 M23 family metallopeptidase [Hyphomicrobium sp.]
MSLALAGKAGMRLVSFLLGAVVVPALVLCSAWGYSYLEPSEGSEMKKGYDIRKTGLVPVYPKGYACSPLTSFYASWLDVDGTHRDEIHSGVDGGQLGEWILAPAAGTVRAVWEADWQWGKEGALLVVHTAEDLNLEGEGAAFYYTVYDHLKYDEIAKLKPGQKIARGERLARVYRPGGHAHYLPEVHWEVWEVEDDTLTWTVNRYGGREWRNPRARLIDPLYMLGVHRPPDDGRSVSVVPFERGRNYSKFRGFTYIFQCRKT